MRSLNKMIWAALIAGATGTPVFAQGTMAGGGGVGAGGGAGGSTGGGSTTGGTGSGATLSTLGTTPVLSAPTASGGNSGNSLSTSNFLTPYYGNPYYQGVLSNAMTANSPPGGFGAVLFNGTSGSGGGTIGSAAGTIGGATAGGRATTGGGKGGTTNTNSNQQGPLIPVQVQMSYQCKADFPIAPIIPSQLQAELVAMIGRSKAVSNPAAIQISTNADIVTVRGVATSRDEARTIESMIRMTPGVHGVKNEIAYPTK
jgi:hypothetical protein